LRYEYDQERLTDEEQAKGRAPRARGLQVHLGHRLTGDAGENRLQVTEGKQNRQQKDQPERAAAHQNRWLLDRQVGSLEHDTVHPVHQFR